jgi:hypothetical protein
MKQAFRGAKFLITGCILSVMAFTWHADPGYPNSQSG